MPRHLIDVNPLFGSHPSCECEGHTRDEMRGPTNDRADQRPASRAVRRRVPAAGAAAARPHRTDGAGAGSRRIQLPRSRPARRTPGPDHRGRLRDRPCRFHRLRARRRRCRHRAHAEGTGRRRRHVAAHPRCRTHRAQPRRRPSRRGVRDEHRTRHPRGARRARRARVERGIPAPRAGASSTSAPKTSAASSIPICSRCCSRRARRTQVSSPGRASSSPRRSRASTHRRGSSITR